MIFGRKKIKLRKLIGEGLNARVYSGKLFDPVLGFEKEVAFKVFKESKNLKLFRKELENLMKVRSSNCISVLGWEWIKKRPALILERVYGENLQTLLPYIQSSSGLVKQSIVRQIYEALKSLESFGIAHGDLSLSNIMLSRDGEIKLLDFGLSDWRTQAIEVTPQFAAPETLKENRINFNSDLFSLGKIASLFNVDTELSTGLLDENPELRRGYLKNLLHFRKEMPKGCLNQLYSSFDSGQDQTKQFSVSKVKSGRSKKFFVPLLFLVLSSSVGIPSESKMKSLILRSKDWSAIKISKSDEWCFAPCQLNIKSRAKVKLYWKTSSGAGIKTIELPKAITKISERDLL